MRLVKLPLNCIVNLDNLCRVDFSKDDSDTGAWVTLTFAGDAPETKVEYTGDDAERVWAYLVEQSSVLV